MAVETTPGDLPLASLKQELIDSLPEGKEWTNSDTCVTGNLMFLTISDAPNEVSIDVSYTSRDVWDYGLSQPVFENTYTLSGTLSITNAAAAAEGATPLYSGTLSSNFLNDVEIVNNVWSETYSETQDDYYPVSPVGQLFDAISTVGSWESMHMDSVVASAPNFNHRRVFTRISSTVIAFTNNSTIGFAVAIDTSGSQYYSYQGVDNGAGKTFSSTTSGAAHNTINSAGASLNQPYSWTSTPWDAVSNFRFQLLSMSIIHTGNRSVTILP